MATLSDKQIQDLVGLIDRSEFTLMKAKDTLGIKDAPPPILMSNPSGSAASGKPPPPPSGMMPPPAPAMGGMAASASSTMKPFDKVEALAKIQQAIIGLGSTRTDFQNALPGHPKGIEGSIEETFVTTMTKLKVSDLTPNLRQPWVQGIILAVKGYKFKQPNKDTEIDRLQNHKLPALIGQLEQEGEYEFIYEIHRRVKNFKDGDGGFDQLSEWLRDELRKRAEKARQAKLMSNPHILEKVREYEDMQQEFLRLHDELKKAILDDHSDVTLENYEAHPKYKRMQQILETRGQVDNQLSKIITQSRKLNEKAEKVKNGNDRILQNINEQMHTVEQNIIRLQGEEAKIPPQDKESLLAARVNIELNEQKKRLLQRERQEFLQKIESFKELDGRVMQECKNVVNLLPEKLLTEEALRACSSEVEEVKAEQELYAEAFKPGKAANHPAVSKEGKLRIQLIDEETQRKTVAREQSTTVGLIVAAGRHRYLVLDNDAEISPSGLLPRLGLNVVAEKDAKAKIQEATSGASGIAMTSQAVYLGAFTPSQLKRIAYFCGPEVSMDFDPSKPEHMTELDLILSAAISNSSITMGDVMLVALGYRTRPVDFLSKFLDNKLEGYTFSPEFAKHSLFSEALVVSHEEGASEEHKSRVYGHKEDLNPALEEQMPEAAVQNAPRQDGARLAIANSFDHVNELETLMRETAQAMETLRQKQAALLEVKDNDEGDPDYVASLKTLHLIEQNMPTEHPQAELCRYLSNNPDVYHDDGKLMLAKLFTAVVLRLDNAKSLVSDVNKEISSIDGKIRAAIEAKERLKQQEQAEQQFKVRLREIRDGIKETMLGGKDVVESPPMTDMLDRMAKLEYESNYGKLPTAEEQVAQQQTQVQQQMAMATQTLKVEQAQGSLESVERVKLELQALQSRYGELEQEMIALKQLTAAPKAAASAPDSERVRELEAQNLRLQEQLSKAKSGVPEPENFGAACRQFNDIKAVIEWAKRTDFGPIDESQAVTQLAGNVRGAARISAVNNITSAVGEYNSSLKKPATRKGF